MQMSFSLHSPSNTFAHMSCIFWGLDVFFKYVVLFHVSFPRPFPYELISEKSAVLSLIRLHRKAYGSDLQNEEKNPKFCELLIPHRARASKLIKLKYAVRSEITVFL